MVPKSPLCMKNGGDEAVDQNKHLQQFIVQLVEHTIFSQNVF